MAKLQEVLSRLERRYHQYTDVDGYEIFKRCNEFKGLMPNDSRLPFEVMRSIYEFGSYFTQLKMAGSFARHGADLALLGKTSRGEASRRIRFYEQPLYDQESHKLSSGAVEAYRELLIESDSDGKIIIDGKPNVKLDRLYPALTTILLPQISAHLTDPDNIMMRHRQQWQKELDMLARTASKTGERDIRVEQSVLNLGRHWFNLDDLPAHWGFAARIHAGEGFTPPIWLEDIRRYGIILDAPTWILSAKREQVRGIMDVVTIGLGADLSPAHYAEPIVVEKIQPLAKVDITIKKSNDPVKDNRNPISGSTHEIHASIAPSVIKEPGKFDQQSFNLRYGQQELTQYELPVDLGPEWENKNIFDALEVASRAIYHAIDEETAMTLPGPRLSEEALQRIANRVNTSGEEILSQMKEHPFQLKSIRHNFLKAMVLSPHRWVEYAGKSRFFDLLFSQQSDLSWHDVLQKLEETMPRDEFHDKNKNTRHPSKYISGWKLMDAALSLDAHYSDTSYLERLYKASTIGGVK